MNFNSGHTARYCISQERGQRLGTGTPSEARKPVHHAIAIVGWPGKAVPLAAGPVHPTGYCHTDWSSPPQRSVCGACLLLAELGGYSLTASTFQA